MKKVKVSFLFFIGALLLSVANIQQLHAQSQKDSLAYYYTSVSNPKSNTDLAKGYNFFKRHKEESIQNKEFASAIYDLRMMASIEKKLGLLSDSEISSVEALQVLNTIDPSHEMVEEWIGVYNHLGIIYRELKNYDKSLEFYTRILENTTKKEDKVTVLNNIGNVYIDQGKYQDALYKFKEALTVSDNLSKKLEARVLSNLGFVQSTLDLEGALANLEKAKQIREELQYTSGMLTSYNHLAAYYRHNHQIEKAKVYANKAVALARASKNGVYLESALSTLMELNDAPEVVEYTVLKDSIETANQRAKDNFAYYRYQFSEKERQIKESELEKEKLVIVMILIVSCSILLFLILKIRHRHEKLEQVYKTESRISKKIHDEVANDVYHVISKIQSQDYKVLDNLEDIYNKTRDISKENNAIDLEGDFNTYLNDMLLSFKNDKVTVITNNIGKVPWNRLSKVKKATIYRVLQELMVNMAKHSNATHTVLRFSQELSSLSIFYKDNGKGCVLHKKGGLVNVENRIKTINGTITFESEPTKGFSARIKV